MADFAAQAVINTVLMHAFPNDPIVGEEDASDLRTNDALRARVVELADDVLVVPPRAGTDTPEERAEWGLGRRWGADALLSAIDRGRHGGGQSGRTSLSQLVFCSLVDVFFWRGVGMWTLDPIDGTKGFLRAGQYAVCLALLVDARVELGVIGCPNLPLDAGKQHGGAGNGGGALFVAVRGQGAHQLPLVPSAEADAQERRLTMPRLGMRDLAFLESVEKAHAALDTHARIAARLGVRAPPVRMDSQAKYAALVRGDAGGGVYMRMPRGTGYQEKIWVCVHHIPLLPAVLMMMMLG